MKLINATATLNGVTSLYLAERRLYPRLATSDLKRQARRQQRHSLRSTLDEEVNLGIREGTIHPLPFVHEEVSALVCNLIPNSIKNLLAVSPVGKKLFAVAAANTSVQFSREVPVIRKRPNIRKPLKEFLVLAA